MSELLYAILSDLKLVIYIFGGAFGAYGLINLITFFDERLTKKLARRRSKRKEN